MNAARSTEPDGLVRPYAPRAGQAEPLGPVPVAATAAIPDAGASAGASATAVWDRPRAPRTPPAEPPASPASLASPAPAGSHLTPARPRRRSRPALLALLVLGATAAAIVTLVEVTAPSGGAPARALPAVGASPEAGGALPTTAATATATASGTQSPSGGSASPRNPAPTSAAAGARVGSSASAAATGTASDPLSAPRNQSATPAVLGPGDRGADVADLQRQLFDQGFTYVAVTGVFDQATTRGVTQLQQNRGITGDPAGVYGPHTRAALEASG